MSWNPKLKVIDISQVAKNLFTFFEANQEDALAWAAGETITPFKKFYPSASGRLTTVLPCLMLLRQEQASDPNDDVLKATLTLVFEGMLQGGNADELVRTSMRYGEALESMLANISSAQLTANSRFPIDAQMIAPLATEYDVIHGDPSAWRQYFRTSASFKLETTSHI